VEALRQKQLHGSDFQAGVLTNLNVDHLATCRTQEQYQEIKARFFSELAEGTKAIFNADDPHSLSVAREGQWEIITCAVDYASAVVVAENIRCRGLVTLFNLTVTAEFTDFFGRVVQPGSHPASFPVPGKHSLTNALLAATLTLLAGAGLADVARALASFPGVRRHMETLQYEDLLVIDDAARNPAAIHAALSTAASLKQGKIIILHGMAGGGGSAMNRCNALELARWLARRPQDLLIVTRGMYHTKNRHQVRLSEEKAFLGTAREQGIPFAYFPDLPDALESAMLHARREDTLLLMGGPVLHRARELLLQNFKAMQAAQLLVPSDIAPVAPDAAVQSIAANPT
jgi:UDP-N-acetylmuramoyl-L-alanyl-D-glutamate--2,6-diaminopimelate ligase